ncbi:hypothetical protein ACQZV8_15710, partial [Magnetococcales bacterium HHB-1]
PPQKAVIPNPNHTTAPIPPEPKSRLWIGLALFFASGWLITLIILLRKNSNIKLNFRKKNPKRSDKLWRKIVQAQNAPQAKAALLNWGEQQFPENPPQTLKQLCEQTPSLKNIHHYLNQILYHNRESWSAQHFKAILPPEEPALQPPDMPEKQPQLPTLNP